MRVPRHPFLLGWLLPDSRLDRPAWRPCWRPPPGFLNADWRSGFADSNPLWLGPLYFSETSLHSSLMWPCPTALWAAELGLTPRCPDCMRRRRPKYPTVVAKPMPRRTRPEGS